MAVTRLGLTGTPAKTYTFVAKTAASEGLGYMIGTVAIAPRMLGDVNIEPRMKGTVNIEPRMDGVVDIQPQ